MIAKKDPSNEFANILGEIAEAWVPIISLMPQSDALTIARQKMMEVLMWTNEAYHQVEGAAKKELEERFVRWEGMKNTGQIDEELAKMLANIRAGDAAVDDDC